MSKAVVKPEADVSEVEDEPEEFQDSGEDWKPDAKDKKRGNRRASNRLKKKPKVAVKEESSNSEEEEEDEDEEEEEGEGGGGGEGEVDEDEEDEDSDSDSESPESRNGTGKKKSAKRLTPAGMKIPGKDFVTGSFVVLKKDLRAADTKSPPLWRIDGKALLQKYEPFEEDGKKLHRSTSIYTGWTAMDKDLYSPVSVQVQQHAAQSMIVEVQPDALKTAALDSD